MEKTKETKSNIKKILSHIPQSTGVYLLHDALGNVIYVGKARNINNRVKTHLLEKSLSKKEQKLALYTDRITWEETVSEFAALLREAELIRHHSPKYNAIAKDDKSPIYIVIPLYEKNPIISLKRKTALHKYVQKTEDSIKVFGPFQSASVARNILSKIRTIIPFCQSKKFNGTPCFYTQLGLCNPCPSDFSVKNPDDPIAKQKRREYAAHIRQITSLLEGKSNIVRAELDHEMRRYAKNYQYEKAGEIKHMIEAIQHLYAQSFITSFNSRTNAVDADNEIGMQDLQTLLLPYFPKLTRISRIECIDISNMYGFDAVGSLVVMVNGIPSPGDYRRFRIKGHAQNDMHRMKEVLNRRIKHKEWPCPDLLILDGGKAQISVVRTMMKRLHILWPIIGIAKRFEQLIIPFGNTYTTITLPIGSRALSRVLVIRDEAHRFAKKYHIAVRKVNFLKQS